jgi:eukaryotic-like serine/threonine-protein kinase
MNLPDRRDDEAPDLDPAPILAAEADPYGTVVGANDSQESSETVVGESQESVQSLMAGALGDPAARRLPVVPGYEVLGELGRGGMGVVYRARQVRLNRPCALKMILAGDHAAPEALARFMTEAEAVARLRHPNVVQIHHIAEHDGRPYVELELVEGGSLEARLDGTPWPPREAVRLVEALARTIAEAHRLGIIHRDLKPGNILLAADGTPKVADFGLAKRLQVDSGLTQTNSVMGSPSYMAPEQAQGQARSVGPAADVYALGAIFYELLTGRPPFRAATPLETLDQVRSAEPVPPSRLQLGLPRDAETIALKCLQKDPARRYGSAADLAEDLRRFLAREPILARPTGPLERAWRWCLRNPVVAGLLGAVAVLMGLLTAGALVFASGQAALALKEARLKRETSAKLYRALLGEASALRRERAPGYRSRVWRDLHEALALEAPGRDLREVRDEVLACLGDPLAMDPIPAPSVRRAARRALPEHFRRFAGASRLDVTEDGRFLAIGQGWAEVTLRDRTGAVIALAASPLGSIHALRFRPDGQLLVAGCEEGFLVWSVPDLKLLASVRGASVGSVAVHPAGHLMALRTAFSQAELWSLDARRLLATIPFGQGAARVEFDAEGGHLLAISPAQEVRAAWPVSATPEKTLLAGHRGGVTGLAFSPDGRVLATVSKDRTLRLWDARTGALRHATPSQEAAVQAVAFSADGTLVATGDWDGTLHLWDAASGSERSRCRPSRWLVQVWRVRFDPSGRYLAAAGPGALVICPIDRPAAGPALCDGLVVRRLDHARDLAIHPDGMSLAIRTTDEEVFRYDLGGGVRKIAEGMSRGNVLSLEFSPDGRLLRTLNRRGELIACDWSTGAIRRGLGSLGDLPMITLSGDGRWLATHVSPDRLVLYDLTTEREVLRLPPEANTPWCHTFSPDGTRLAVGLSDGGLAIWDLAAVRAQLAEFGIAVPSTARDPSAAPASPRPEATAIDRVLANQRLNRAYDLAGAGRWQEAIAGIERALRDGADGEVVHRDLGLLRLQAGDLAGYRAQCAARLRGIVPGAAAALDPEQANNLAWECVLAPGAVADPEVPVRLARAAVAAFEGAARGGALNTLGAALVRAGRFEEAIRRIDEGIRLRRDEDVPLDWVFLAMSHFRLGHIDEARRYLAKLALSESEDFWSELEVRLLHREAEALIVPALPGLPADVFAPGP